jgi:hypothetical protein
MTTVSDLVDAVVRECAQRGVDMSDAQASAAVRIRVVPIANAMDVSEAAIVSGYADETMVLGVTTIFRREAGRLEDRSPARRSDQQRQTPGVIDPGIGAQEPRRQSLAHACIQRPSGIGDSSCGCW